MPGALEEYIEHFQAADAATRRLQTMLGELLTRITQARQSPQILTSPSIGKWPTQDELHKLAEDVQIRTAPLQAEYNRLPEEFRRYAPQPQNLGK